MRASLLCLALLLSLAPLSAPALAGVPSAANSTVPACLVACPFGDVAFDVVVRDLANNPIAASAVVIDFSQCPGAFICSLPGNTPDPYTVNLGNRTLTLASNASGLAHFPLRVGGGCAANTVKVYADGVLLAQRTLASPDQDANGYVIWLIGNDYPLFEGKFGTSDPTADFDCDGDVDAVDESTFFSHNSHACEGFVDSARRGSWGRLKAHYR